MWHTMSQSKCGKSYSKRLASKLLLDPGCRHPGTSPEDSMATVPHAKQDKHEGQSLYITARQSIMWEEIFSRSLKHSKEQEELNEITANHTGAEEIQCQNLK